MKTKTSLVALSLLIISASGCSFLLPGQIKVYVPKTNKTYLLEKENGSTYSVSELVNSRSSLQDNDEEDNSSKTVFNERNSQSKNTEKSKSETKEPKQKDSEPTRETKIVEETKKATPEEIKAKNDTKPKKTIEDVPTPKPELKKTVEQTKPEPVAEKSVEEIDHNTVDHNTADHSPEEKLVAPPKEEALKTVAVQKEEPKKEIKKEDASGSEAEITPKGDLVHYVTSSKESLQQITQWYTNDASNAGKVARINQISPTQKLSVGDVVVIPSYLVKNKKILP